MSKALAAMTAEFKTKLGTNAQWAEAAILALYERQTADEQLAEATEEHNGMGFTGVDAKFLSSLAAQIKASRAPKGKRLSPKQLVYAFKKLPKYAAQLAKVAEEKHGGEAATVVIDTVYVHPDVAEGNAFGALEAKQEAGAYMAMDAEQSSDMVRKYGAYGAMIDDHTERSGWRPLED